MNVRRGFRAAQLPVLAALASCSSTASAQLIPGRTTEGVVRDGAEVPVCQTAGGGTRTAPNCEVESTTVTVQQELRLSIELPALPSTQCEATSATEYQQRDTMARVNTTLAVADCTAASGELTVAARIRDAAGEMKSVEFTEAWQRSGDQDLELTADYPIGANVDLLNVRVRKLTCTCADAPSGEAGGSLD